MALQKFKTNVQMEGELVLSSKTASRALELDGSGNITHSATTSTELGYLNGVTSGLQGQLDAKVDESREGAANGIATLDGSGKLASGQIPASLIGSVSYQGTWNATTNSPSISDATGAKGYYYVVTVAGSQDLGSGSITFDVGDWAIHNGTIYERLNDGDVISVNSQTGAVVLDTDDISEGATNLYFSDERAQDAVGTILTDSSSIDFTYNDGTPSITAVVLPAGVDHNSLQNYSANRHIDHSAVEIQTQSNSGLSGGGDITSTRSLVVDINGTTAETVPAGNDEVLIWDTSASARRKMTRSNFLSGISIASAGDINETSFSAANNQAAAADVTGLAFANATVRSFNAQVSVSIDATSDLFEVFELKGIQKGASWDMAISSVGDNSGLVFTITNAGQVQYTSTNLSGFVSNTTKFRASTTSV